MPLLPMPLHMGRLETFIIDLGGQLVARGHEVQMVTTEDRGEWFARTAFGAIGDDLLGGHLC